MVGFNYPFVSIILILIRPHQGSVCSCKAQKHPHPLVGLCSGVLWGSQNDRSGSTGLCGRLRAWPPQFPQLCLLMCWQPLWAGVRLPSDSGLPSLQDSGWKRMRGSLLSGRERRKRKEPSEPFPETSIPAFSCHIWTDNQQGGVPSLLGHQSAAAHPCQPACKKEDIGPAVTRAQPPAFPRNPRGRLGFPGPTQGEG